MKYKVRAIELNDIYALVNVYRIAASINEEKRNRPQELNNVLDNSSHLVTSPLGMAYIEMFSLTIMIHIADWELLLNQ